ncbi:MAG: response regulator [Anaerolineales bacterium]|nr:response regulator [Anaerolineales bacterium]
MARILVVDDESDLVDYLAGELKFAGFQTDTAYNGVEAILKVLDHTPNVVLMDVRMPKLDGINALKIIRRIAPELPVLMFTGQAGQGDMYEATRLGAFTCLLKPIAIEDLLNVLQQVLVQTPNKKIDILHFN